MKPSIASRISRVQFFTTCSLIVVFASTSYLLTLFIEKSLLAQDFEEERTFIMEQYGTDNYFQHSTKSIFIEYIPNNSTVQSSSNSIFKNININSQEQIKHEGKAFWVAIKASNNGIFYHARNLTALKERENQYLLIDAIITLLILITAWVISKITSVRIVRQLSLLSEKVKSIKIDQSIVKIEEDLPDFETASLAISFNAFLSELERFVIRERTMIGLASHELRTPIAVILGAVDVLQKEGISKNQEKNALERIESATTEMNSNVTSLLRLSRKQDNTLDLSNFKLETVISEVINDLSSVSAKPISVELCVQEECALTSDRVLVKLLLRNLIQNSLQHTQSTTKITLHSNKFIITDTGEGLPNHLKDSLDRQNPDQTLSQSQGLGLYIVMLICERLEWKTNLTSNKQTHHYFEILF